jgi:hypothetical protein
VGKRGDGSALRPLEQLFHKQKVRKHHRFSRFPTEAGFSRVARRQHHNIPDAREAGRQLCAFADLVGMGFSITNLLVNIGVPSSASLLLALKFSHRNLV